MNTTRSRWAAIGAAVAVTLGAGGVGISQATTDSGDGPVSAFFPIEPCRLADTRPAPNTVGPRTSPLGPGETETFAGWGTAGNCTLPSGTSGLSLNVTAVGATSQTNLRFFPADSDVPTAANLNPTPGAPPTPNAVNVALDGSGEFSIFNAFGSVAVVVDVVGYYDDHTHDDRYYTEAEVDAALEKTKFISLNVYGDPALNFDNRWADLNDMGVGGLNLDVDYNFTVPPDFTPGTTFEIHIVAYARTTTAFPCNGELSQNWMQARRPGVTDSLDTGSPRLNPTTINQIYATAGDTKAYVFESNPVLQLEPGDAVGFGLFGLGPATRCDLAISGISIHYS